MDPQTIQLILFSEQLAALLAKTIIDIKNIIQGSHTQTVDEILADADSTYQQIINNAKNPPTPPVSS